MKNGVILVTDKNYINHTQSLVHAVRKYGKIKDISIITNYDNSQNDFPNEDVINFQYSEGNYNLKYKILDDTITDRYDKILYLDADVVILDDLNPLFNEYNTPLSAVLEPFTVKETMISLAPIAVQNRFEKEHGTEIVVNRKSFNSGIMLIETSYLYNNQLKEIRNEYRQFNYHVRGIEDGGDQPIFNLFFNNEWRFSPLLHAAFWKDYKENKHRLLHFCHWDAPWYNNTFNKCIGKTYKEYYLENLESYR